MEAGFITLDVHIDSSLSETLQILISELGFPIFLETEDGFQTSVEEQAIDASEVHIEIEKLSKQFQFTYEIRKDPKVNYNALWESNFPPVEIEGVCRVRADFHESSNNYPIEIRIHPKMSFGTGHHQTTRLMLLQLFPLQIEGKTVADLGAGTGILGIYAALRGAASVVACDVEDWSAENTTENAVANNVSVHSVHGTVQDIPEGAYDIILANINRNVLLSEMHLYSQRCASGGFLLLSGFIEEDIPLIETSAHEHGFKTVKLLKDTHWVSLSLQK